MKRVFQAISGVLSLVPLVYIILFMGFVILAATGVISESHVSFNGLIIIHFSATLVIVITAIIFVIHLIFFSGASEGEQPIWLLLLLFFGLFIFPVYWYKFVLGCR